jgi:protein FAM32A
MPGDDYTATVGGGLKLKGVNSSSKVSKHKKKKPNPESNPEAEQKSKDGEASTPSRDADLTKDAEFDPVERKYEEGLEGHEDTAAPSQAGKTEAELRHEERRRKRVLFFPTVWKQKRG